jgi:hypothetical protein
LLTIAATSSPALSPTYSTGATTKDRSADLSEPTTTDPSPDVDHAADLGPTTNTSNTAAAIRVFRHLKILPFPNCKSCLHQLHH